MKRSGKYLLFMLLLLPAMVYSGDYAASFLDIGVGARALGMGGAFASIANDGSAFYWNPAGLALTRKIQLSGMYGPQFGSIKNPMGAFHYAGYVQPLPARAVVSVNWIRLSIDDIPVYGGLGNSTYWDRLHDISKRPTGDPEGYIKDTEDAFFFYFALMNTWEMDLGWDFHKVRVDLPIGVNIKYLRQKLGEGEASGIGLDIGTMLRFHLGDFTQVDNMGILAFGLNIQDVTDTKLSWNTRHVDPLGTNFKWGISYQQPLEWISGYLNIGYDRDSRYSRSHLGIEYMAFNIIGLRAGFTEGGFTCGMGLKLWVFQVDYAFLTHELDALHRINCSVTI